MEGPTPMDVGKIDNECESEERGPGGRRAAVSWSTQCLGCGGSDNLRRECPSVAKDGKGGKALGKKGPGGRSKGKGLSSSTKGGQKGDGRGTKGSGKGGFKGSCFLCDQQEHRANECRTHSANVEEEDEEEAVRRSLDGRGVDEWPTKGVNANQGVEVRDLFEVLAVETDKDWKMTSAIEFNVAGVPKPLASAARIVKSGNRVVLDQGGSFIENKRTGEGDGGQGQGRDVCL